MSFTLGITQFSQIHFLQKGKKSSVQHQEQMFLDNPNSNKFWKCRILKRNDRGKIPSCFQNLELSKKKGKQKSKEAKPQMLFCQYLVYSTYFKFKESFSLMSE